MYYTPFGRFATSHTTAISFNVNNFPVTIHEKKMPHAAKNRGTFTKLFLDRDIRDALHSSRIENDAFRLMECFTNVLINRTRFIRSRCFDFPFHTVDEHICGGGSVLLAATDELHGHARHSKRLGRLIFVRPDVKVWRDDDLSSRLFHGAHYTACRVSILEKKESKLGFIT